MASDLDQPSADLSEASKEPMALEPTDAELDDWVERERQRRRAWLEGPTPEERAEHASRMRDRRLSDLSGEGGLDPNEFARLMRRYPREAQLAAEGAMSLLWKWSRHSLAELVRAGREWEEEVAGPRRRRRVALDDDEID
ncbi:MAG: hypothetical protein ACJ761_07405 [Chloroflexota bacterium]